LNAAILANHGSIGLGKTLMTAQYVSELIEETAHIYCMKNSLINSMQDNPQ